MRPPGSILIAFPRNRTCAGTLGLPDPTPTSPDPEPVRAEASRTGAEPALEEALRRLEARLVRLEDFVGLSAEGAPAAGVVAAPVPEGEGLESQIGEFWLARVGVVALIVGLGFLVAYPFATLPALVPCLIGYAAVAGFALLARWWARSLPDLSRLLTGGALFLAYFATLRLHFFSTHPTLDSRGVALVLLVGVLAAQMWFAVRRRSELTAALVVALSFVTSVVGDGRHFPLLLGSVTAVLALELYRRFHWWRLNLLALALGHGLHLLWLLNNPLAGHPLRGVDAPHFNLGFLAVTTAAFAAAGLSRAQGEEQVVIRILRNGANCLGALLAVGLNARLFHRGEPPWVLAGAAGAFLLVAVAYWRHHRGQFGTGIYACFGYMALSGAIVAWFPSPDYHGWLAWQGLLVAATAVGFRSKIIIVANLFIFGGIYLAYLAVAPATGWINLSFAAVALGTARILNWRQEQLALRTELMRNTYLAAATIIIPYGLYHTVPKSWVSSAWLAAAAGYFLASVVLGNAKYRRMAMATVLATVGYVFIVDLSRLEPAYRIVSFLILGVALLVISMIYARRRKRPAA